jgi:hypothetical protein
MRILAIGLMSAALTAGTAIAAPAKPNAVIAEWTRANDACQGGNVAFNSSVCRRRDRLQAQAEKLGWCWAYSDWQVSRADYRWHRCNQAHPA